MRDLIVSTKWAGTYFGRDDFVRDAGYSLDLFGSNSPSTRSAQGTLNPRDRLWSMYKCYQMDRGRVHAPPDNNKKLSSPHQIRTWLESGSCSCGSIQFRNEPCFMTKGSLKVLPQLLIFKKNGWYELYNSSVAMDPTAISDHEVASRPQVEDYSRLSGSQTLHFTIKVSDCDPSTEHRELFLSWAKSASFLARNLSDDCGISAAIHQPW